MLCLIIKLLTNLPYNSFLVSIKVVVVITTLTKRI
jgi:hypothetical protein